MAAQEKSAHVHVLPAHPVVLLARAIGVVVGVLLLMAHAPALWPVVGGLVAYSTALAVCRSAWPASAPAEPGRAART